MASKERLGQQDLLTSQQVSFLTFLSRQKVKSRSIFLPARCALITISPLNQIQMIAWGTMNQDFSKDLSLTKAAEMAFSRVSL